MTLAALLTATLLAQDVQCAAQISYYEARGEDTYTEKVAPILVARNRVLSDQFPNTFCRVMEQENQFAFVSNDLHLLTPSEREAWDIAQVAAQSVLDMPIHAYERPLGGSMYFHSGEPPNWDFKKLEKVVTLGGHSYYKDREEN